MKSAPMQRLRGWFHRWLAHGYTVGPVHGPIDPLDTQPAAGAWRTRTSSRNGRRA